MIWRWALALLLVFVAVVVPLPPGLPSWAEPVRAGVGAGIIVCILGKLLYDTLFYDGLRR